MRNWRTAAKANSKAALAIKQEIDTSEGGRHALGQAQKPEAIQALPYLPEIIKKAFKVAEYNPHASTAQKPDLRRAVIYRSAVVIDDQPYSVKLVAKRKKSGRLELDFYDLRAMKKPGRPAVTQVLPGDPVELSPTPIQTDLPAKEAPPGLARCRLDQPVIRRPL
ncbi:MAG: hypothetical protein LBV21_01730 [Candidatus Adiutrix sp.]|nr:hypothetical protein [Candidatus Adiutrix sp.]